MGFCQLRLELLDASKLLSLFAHKAALLRLKDGDLHAEVVVDSFQVRNLGLKTFETDQLLEARTTSGIRVLGALGHNLLHLFLRAENSLLALLFASRSWKSS